MWMIAAKTFVLLATSCGTAMTLLTLSFSVLIIHYTSTTSHATLINRKICAGKAISVSAHGPATTKRNGAVLMLRADLCQTALNLETTPSTRESAA